MPFERVILIVLDSVGIGEMPDAGVWRRRQRYVGGHVCAYPSRMLFDQIKGARLACLGERGIPEFQNFKHCGRHLEDIGSDAVKIFAVSYLPTS